METELVYSIASGIFAYYETQPPSAMTSQEKKWSQSRGSITSDTFLSR
jgi:hypothetical protein